MAEIGKIYGWPAVDRQLEAARENARLARTSEQFRAVGDACAGVLFYVLQAVHSPNGGRGPKLRLDQTVRELLDAFIANSLDGGMTGIIKSCLDDADHSIHSGTADEMSANLCLLATETVVKYIAIAAGRRQSRETVRDLCGWFISAHPTTGRSQQYTIQKIAASPLGDRVASELTEEDVMRYTTLRRMEGIGGATLTQDITYLRGVLIAAREHLQVPVPTAAVDAAKDALRKAGVIEKSAARKRRITREELQSLVSYFERAQDKERPSKIPMRDIMEFALWSARRISEICELRWSDLDEQNRTCVVMVTDATGKVRRHVFPLLGKAFDIVMRQPRRSDSDRIFPYNAKSAGQAYTRAKKELGIEDLRFQDLRREAAIRLYEAGHSIEQISKVTGRMDLNTLRKDLGIDPSSEGGTDS